MKKGRKLLQGVMGFTMVCSFAGLGSAGEIQIGKTIERHGMEIAAVYLEPAVSQDDYWGGVPKEEGAVIHLEADIHATKDQKHGLGAGDWIPYLTVEYRLRNLKTGEEQEGLLWQMVATDGLHYGKNITLKPGNYRLVLTIENPSIRRPCPPYRQGNRGPGVVGSFKRRIHVRV